MSQKQSRHVYEFEEEYGTILLTKYQHDFIIEMVTKPESKTKHSGMGSTSGIVYKKIINGTGWKLFRLQAFCRFAYKHGLVRL